MDHWRSHIPRNNPPKQFCERCFEQGDQKWQQNELGLGFELVSDVCRRKKECVVAGISGGEPPWAHEAGARPGGWARPGPSWPGAGSPCCVLSARYSQIFQKKIIFNFQGIWRTFIFGVFLYCKNNSDNRQKILFLFYFI